MKLCGSRVGSLVDGVAVAGEAFEDLVGGLVPHERGRVGVPVVDPGLDVGGEGFDRLVGGSLQLLGGQCGEQSFDEVHPRPVGGGEVEVEAAVTKQPFVHGRGLVGGQVVQDHVHVQVGGDL